MDYSHVDCYGKSGCAHNPIYPLGLYKIVYNKKGEKITIIPMEGQVIYDSRIG